jgi:DNA-binding transcriptional ArsR family regulator
MHSSTSMKTAERPAPLAPELKALQDIAVEASALLRLLANPDRLLLMCQLAEGERCVSELEALTGIRQPTLSQQLTVLRSAALVATRREGKLVYYRVCDANAIALMQTLYAIYCGPVKKKGSKK